MNLEKQVRDWMRQQNMAACGDLVAVALSGGKDSVCLLTILEAIREELGISLCAMHVHHGIRGEEADRDAAFCQALCREKGIPFSIAHVDVPAAAAAGKQSLEEAARTARYEALEAYRQRTGAARIAVAHHQSDQAETVIWNLCRGSGLRGLGGIRPVNGPVIRPLLAFSREQLDEYAREKGLRWCEDSTNQTDHCTRNRIRRHVLPFLTEEVNDLTARHICQTAALAGEADGYLQRQAARWMEAAGHMRERPGAGQLELDAAALAAEEPLLRTYVIRAACARVGGSLDLGRAHVEAVQSLLTVSPGGSARRRVSLIHGMQVIREYDRLIFLASPERAAGPDGTAAETAEAADAGADTDGWEERLPDFSDGKTDRVYPVAWGGKTFYFRVFTYNKKENFPTNRYTKWMNYDKIEGPLVLRYRRTGDYIGLSGGGTKSVKSYMVDEKIPAGSRDRIPVLADGRHVLWIVGYRISELAKITADTEKVLEISMCGGESDGNSSGVDFGAGCESSDCHSSRAHQ